MEYIVEKVLPDKAGIVVREDDGKRAIITGLTCPVVGITFCKVTKSDIYFKTYKYQFEEKYNYVKKHHPDTVPDLTACLAIRSGYGPYRSPPYNNSTPLVPALPHKLKDIKIGLSHTKSEWRNPSPHSHDDYLLGNCKDAMQRLTGTIEYCTFGDDANWTAFSNPLFSSSPSSSQKESHKMTNFRLDEKWNTMPQCLSCDKLRSLYDNDDAVRMSAFLNGQMDDGDGMALLCATMSTIAASRRYEPKDQFTFPANEPLYVWHAAFTMDYDGCIFDKLEDMDIYYSVLAAYGIQKEKSRNDVVQAFFGKAKDHLNVESTEVEKQTIMVLWEQLRAMVNVTGSLGITLEKRKEIEKLQLTLSKAVEIYNKPDKIVPRSVFKNRSPLFTAAATSQGISQSVAEIVEQLVFEKYILDSGYVAKKYVKNLKRQGKIPHTNTGKVRQNMYIDALHTRARSSGGGDRMHLSGHEASRT